jgi:hypothetical protein
MIKDNTHLSANNELLIQYYKGLIGNLFKILPVYEGRDLVTKKIIFTQENAFNNFQKYTSSLFVEICGNYDLFFYSDNSVKMISLLRGILKEVDIDEHNKLKPIVMQCINLCNKVIKELECDADGL